MPASEKNAPQGPTPAWRPQEATKAERRTARARIGAYHEAELAKLIDRLRDGLERYDAGEIDAFELDDLVHRYKRATQKLWSFCVGTGSDAVRAAGRLDWAEREGELPDWWAAAEPRHRH